MFGDLLIADFLKANQTPLLQMYLPALKFTTVTRKHFITVMMADLDMTHIYITKSLPFHQFDLEINSTRNKCNKKMRKKQNGHLLKVIRSNVSGKHQLPPADATFLILSLKTSTKEASARDSFVIIHSADCRLYLSRFFARRIVNLGRSLALCLK